jgi:peptide/nickel transport system permease protein
VIVNKIAYALLTLLGVVTVIFFLFNVLPGDPAKMMLGQNQNAEQLELVKKKYGFDQPLGIQYLYYLNDLSPVSLHSTKPDHYTFLSDQKYSYQAIFRSARYTLVIKAPYLRESFTKQGKKVSDVIRDTFPNTVILASSAILIAILLGVSLGVISAIYKDSILDRAIQILSTLGMSVPSFFSAIIFAWLFGYILHEITSLEMTGSLYELDDFGETVELQIKKLDSPSNCFGNKTIGSCNSTHAKLSARGAESGLYQNRACQGFI